MSEMSVMTSRKSRLKQQATSSQRAARALALSEKPEAFLSTVQIGITLIGVLTGMFGGESIGRELAIHIVAIRALRSNGVPISHSPKTFAGNLFDGFYRHFTNFLRHFKLNYTSKYPYFSK